MCAWCRRVQTTKNTRAHRHICISGCACVCSDLYAFPKANTRTKKNNPRTWDEIKVSTLDGTTVVVVVASPPSRHNEHNIAYCRATRVCYIHSTECTYVPGACGVCTSQLIIPHTQLSIARTRKKKRRANTYIHTYIPGTRMYIYIPGIWYVTLSPKKPDSFLCKRLIIGTEWTSEQIIYHDTLSDGKHKMLILITYQYILKVVALENTHFSGFWGKMRYMQTTQTAAVRTVRCAWCNKYRTYIPMGALTVTGGHS